MIQTYCSSRERNQRRGTKIQITIVREQSDIRSKVDCCETLFAESVVPAVTFAFNTMS